MSQPMSEGSETLLELLDAPIAFHRVFVKLGGGVTAGLLLSQAFYWSKNRRALERDGWFYKSHAEWEEETGLTRREQQTARAHLRERKLLEEKDGSLKGKGRVLWYRVNRDALFEALNTLIKSETSMSAGSAAAGCDAPPDTHEGAQGVAPNRPTPEHKSARPVAPNRPNPLITTKNTAKTMQENTHTRLRAAGATAVGVCVEVAGGRLKGAYPLATYDRYARNHAGDIRNPAGWSSTARKTGEWDDQVAHWCAAHAIDPRSGEPVGSPAGDAMLPAFPSVGAVINAAECPDCKGRGMFYPDPANPNKGVAKCSHPRLPRAA